MEWSPRWIERGYDIYFAGAQESIADTTLAYEKYLGEEYVRCIVFFFLLL
jgi:hypothetical protein